MTSPPDSMKDPLLDCLYHGLLRFASLPPSKREYGVHSEFFDGSNHLAVKAYVNCPHPSVGAGFFISLFSKDLRRLSCPQRGGRASRFALSLVRSAKCSANGRCCGEGGAGLCLSWIGPGLMRDDPAGGRSGRADVFYR